MAIVLRGLGLDSDVIGPLVTAGLGIQEIAPQPEERPAKRSGSSGSPYQLYLVRKWMEEERARKSLFSQTTEIDFSAGIDCCSEATFKPNLRNAAKAFLLEDFEEEITLTKAQQKKLYKEELLYAYDNTTRQKAEFTKSLMAELEEV